MSVAKEIQKEEPRPASVEVFGRLAAGCGTVPRPVQKKMEISGTANQKGKIAFNQKKRSVRIDLDNIDPARFNEIATIIKKLLG